MIERVNRLGVVGEMRLDMMRSIDRRDDNKVDTSYDGVKLIK